jgi:hypothetical protein
MKAMIGALALALVLGACDKQDEPRPTTSTSPSPAADDKSGTTEPASAQVDDTADIPTEQDFEEEAEQQITAQNLEEELDKLEKEIGEGG